MSGHEILQEALLQEKDLNHQKAYETYLNSIEKSIAKLRILSTENHAEIATIKQALDGVERTLKSLYPLNNTLPTNSGGISESGPVLEIVIPLSPLKKQLQISQYKEHDAHLQYEESLTKDPPEDLKVIRALLQDVEVERMQISKILAQIEQVKDIGLLDYDARYLALHLAYLSRSLWALVDCSNDIFGKERITLQVWRFLSFQEYLYSSMMELCSNLDQVKAVDFLIQVAFSVMYEQKDVATANTLMAIIGNLKIKDLSLVLSASSKANLIKLLDLFGENAIAVHVELIQDLVNAHPVYAPEKVIVPFLGVFVSKSIDASNLKPDEREKYTALLKSTQYSGLSSTPPSDPAISESTLHWILSRHYMGNIQTTKWGKFQELAPFSPPPPAVPTSPLLEDKKQKSQETEMKESDPTAPSDQGPDPNEELMKRLAALKSNKKS